MDETDIRFYKALTYDIIGCALEVHKELGFGLLEEVYQEALSLEFEEKKIKFEQQKTLEIFYKGRKLNKFYRADFICYKSIIVELKSTTGILPEHRAQLINYMKITKQPVGILMNFGEKSFKSEKYILDIASGQISAFSNK